MDNAGNGIRGMRAALSAALLETLRERYALNIRKAHDLGGSSNLNLRVITDDGDYVARVYRPYVSVSRLTAIQFVRLTLAESGVPCIKAVPTVDGEPWMLLEDRLVEVERFVEHDSVMDSWDRLGQGLPWLGRIHSVLQNITVERDGSRPLFANHIDPFETLAGTLRGTQRVRSWNPSPSELLLVEAAEELAERVSFAERPITPQLPRQLVHGDFWHNNVFFHADRVVLVTDFDFMGERARIDDLALTLYYTNSTFSQDRASPARIHLLRSLTDAYNQGLDVPLNENERAALPLAIARQPLWWIGRWLATLDNEDEARRGFADLAPDIAWALQIVRNLELWQEAFV